MRCHHRHLTLTSRRGSSCRWAKTNKMQMRNKLKIRFPKPAESIFGNFILSLFSFTFSFPVFLHVKGKWWKSQQTTSFFQGSGSRKTIRKNKWEDLKRWKTILKKTSENRRTNEKKKKNSARISAFPFFFFWWLSLLFASYFLFK